MRCGELCKSCGGSCHDELTAELYAEIGCEECDETGLDAEKKPCQTCDGRGAWRLTSCPRKFVSELTRAANLLTLCEKGHLPIGGGLLDQSNWFMAFWQMFASETNRIDNEKIEALNRGR